MTEKLYYNDSYTTDFTAPIIHRVSFSGKTGVILDRTFFYPTSGGQEHDTGSINAIPVLDVVETDEGIVHITEQPVEGDFARGEIDWNRRFDYMQQHTGQHILSAACEETGKTPTISAHLGEFSSTIDLDAKRFGSDLAEEIEREANTIVARNLPVTVHFAEEGSVNNYPLRKQPKVGGTIRIVEIEKYDYSACGGTHVRMTGEVGTVKIRKWEKIKAGLTRLEFFCGGRALRDYQWKNRMINDIADSLSLKDSELKEHIDRMLNDSKEKQRTIEELVERLIGYEAGEIALGAVVVNGVRIIKRTFSHRPIEQIRILAQKILHIGPSIVLLGVKADTGVLVFAGSETIPIDLVALIRQVITPLGGKGGGRRNLVQGGIPDTSQVEEALDHAELLIKHSLEK